MDGWAVLSALKAEPDLAETPVIMVTIVQERGLAFSLGAVDYLAKPVDWSRLKRALDRYRSQPAAGCALVVDADAAARAELHGLLEGEGWSVIEAADTDEALRRLGTAAAQLPGLVLVTVQPPGNRAADFIQALHQRPEWRGIPVIALAGGEVSPKEVERLRGQVRRVLPAEAEPPGELIAELRRIAARRAATAPTT
jgi:CheY-like chemotaxis protein